MTNMYMNVARLYGQRVEPAAPMASEYITERLQCTINPIPGSLSPQVQPGLPLWQHRYENYGQQIGPLESPVWLVHYVPPGGKLAW